MMLKGHDPVLTLEPLVEAIEEGVTVSGWTLSGLQKTTSQEFEGRWAGESTRSAYLFFHRQDLPETISVEAFLDETSNGLRANLSLVIEGPPFGEMGDLAQVLARISDAVAGTLPDGYRTPLALRIGLSDADVAPGHGEIQLRVKLAAPSVAMEAGTSAVSALASAAVVAFEHLLERPEIAELLPPVMD
jgi:hypothetical protein